MSDREERAKRRAAAKRGDTPTSAASLVGMMIQPILVAATIASFYQKQRASSDSGKEAGAANPGYLIGLSYAGLALVGNAAVGALRKVVSKEEIGSANQVGVACLIQGLVAVAHSIYTGDITTTKDFVPILPPPKFWLAAGAASAVLSVVKMLETKAFAESDISLCAPFLAFDPVMQFIVGVVFMPFACSAIGLGCEDAKHTYPHYHLLALACVAFGAYSLGGGGKSLSPEDKKRIRYAGPLPVGSWYILANCVMYGFTSRLDRMAIAASSKAIYYAFGRCLMAGTALGGSYAAGGLHARELRELLRPRIAVLLGCVCVADAVYQLSQYQAMAHISPVYVTAIKRGGGILLSSVMGVTLFGESLRGRVEPILTIVFGVTFLCL